MASKRMNLRKHEYVRCPSIRRYVSMNPGQLDTGQLGTGHLDTGQLGTGQLGTHESGKVGQLDTSI